MYFLLEDAVSEERNYHPRMPRLGDFYLPFFEKDYFRIANADTRVNTKNMYLSSSIIWRRNIAVKKYSGYLFPVLLI